MLSDSALHEFISEYNRIFPYEFQPTVLMVKAMRSIADHSIESKYNIMFATKNGTILMHWCLANEDYDRGFNMRAFLEVLRFLQGHKLYATFDYLNNAYTGAIARSNSKVLDGLR